MVKRRVRHRTIDSNGNIVVTNLDQDLGPGAAKMRIASASAAPVGHMDAGSKKPLAGMSKLHEVHARGNAKTNPVTGERLTGPRGGWTSDHMTINKKD